MPLRKATLTDNEAPAGVAPVTNPVAQELAKEAISAYVGRNNGDAKGRQISRQGLFQAALQSPALLQYAPTLEDYLKLVERTADAGLEYVNR